MIRNLPDEATIERFWNNVDKSGDCWVWTAGRCQNYGRFGWGPRTARSRTTTHRLSMILAGHELADKQVLHHCDNPPCVNPDHLYLGNHMDNMRDRMQRNPGSCKTRGNSKLVAGQVRIIRAWERYPWMSRAKLMHTFGINKSSMSMIINRKIWTAA